MSNRMKEIRERSCLTPLQLSKYLHITVEEYFALESGDTPLTTVQLDQLTTLWGCSEGYLLGEINDQDSEIRKFGELDDDALAALAIILKIAKNSAFLDSLLNL